MAFNHLIPMLEVEDMEESITFYQSILGFSCAERVSEEWALLEKDDAQVMLSRRFFKDKYPNTCMTGSLYIYCDDIDVVWQILKDKVEICYPIEDFEYGMREFAIFDCNGYRIQFGHEIKSN